MQPKILVGCPTSDYKAYCLNEYIKGLKRLIYENKDILIADNSQTNKYSKRISSFGIAVEKVPFSESARERIINSRNMIRKKVLDGGYDYFLSLEQDVIPPSDIIERLLKHEKKIITGIYFNKYQSIIHGGIDLIPLTFKLAGKDELEPLSEDELESNKVIEVHAIGLGCVLIHRDVLEKIKFRYIKENNAFDDMNFSKDALSEGFKIYADTSLKCMHLVKNWSWDNIKR